LISGKSVSSASQTQFRIAEREIDQNDGGIKKREVEKFLLVLLLFLHCRRISQRKLCSKLPPKIRLALVKCFFFCFKEGEKVAKKGGHRLLRFA
jgi:hypothetical protein